MKRVFTLLLTLFLLFSPNIDYFFKSRTTGDGSLSTALAFDSVSFGFSKVESTTVSAEVSAKAKQVADVIGGIMYLQQWIDTEWDTIESRSFAKINDDYSSCSIYWTVTSGYYYRLTTELSAALDGHTVTRTANTGSIWVD